MSTGYYGMASNVPGSIYNPASYSNNKGKNWGRILSGKSNIQKLMTKMVAMYGAITGYDDETAARTIKESLGRMTFPADEIPPTLQRANVKSALAEKPATLAAIQRYWPSYTLEGGRRRKRSTRKRSTRKRSTHRRRQH